MKTLITAVILAASMSMGASASPLGCITNYLKAAPYNFKNPNDGKDHILYTGHHGNIQNDFVWHSGLVFPGIWGYIAQANGYIDPNSSTHVYYMEKNLAHCGCTITTVQRSVKTVSVQGDCSTIG